MKTFRVFIAGQPHLIESARSDEFGCYITRLVRSDDLSVTALPIYQICAMGDSVTESLESFQCDCAFFDLTFSFR